MSALLVSHVPVGCDQYVERSGFRCVQKIAVPQSIPTLLRGGADDVLLEVRAQGNKSRLVEEDEHQGGFGLVVHTEGGELYHRFDLLPKHPGDKMRMAGSNSPNSQSEAALNRKSGFSRRQMLEIAGLSAGASLLGQALPRAASARPVASASTASFEVAKEIDAGVLRVGYAEAGPSDGPPVILLHGWPYDIHSFVDVAPLLASKGYRVLAPYLRGYGSTRFLSEQSVRNGQPSALALDAVAFMDALKIDRAVLAGFDWGARTADIVSALWPQRVKALVSVSGYLIGSQEAGKAPLPPKAELQWWYQFYFATARGRAGYEKNRSEFAKLIWQLASPKWNFDDATFARSAASFENPDHVAIVVHNYRWRLGLAEGEPKYDAYEKQLAQGPAITVPTITLEGDANGAPHPEPAVYARKFTGKYEHRNISGGIGHNLPQEAPQAFAQAVIDADRL